ncbi:hypothetical protein AVEN_183363-1 [Araneus ventricosus]|uniref:Uncharacterized protein n=1 Tax=Araneus ventricosus TaxID=182803 RepID=A0A4Y2LY61_ARAVE|nr:hypothetical protein AVEN_183363-1 [Araneus ventricosus]
MMHLLEWNLRGQYYNPSRGAIGMAQALIMKYEYSDGTPATLSQLAKDVCTFLKWQPSQSMIQGKRMLHQALISATAKKQNPTSLCGMFSRVQDAKGKKIIKRRES